MAPGAKANLSSMVFHQIIPISSLIASTFMVFYASKYRSTTSSARIKFVTALTVFGFSLANLLPNFIRTENTKIGTILDFVRIWTFELCLLLSVFQAKLAFRTTKELEENFQPTRYAVTRSFFSICVSFIFAFLYLLLNSGASSNGLVFYHLFNAKKSIAGSIISSLIFVYPQIFGAFAMIAYSYVRTYLNLKKIPAELLEKLNIVPRKMLFYPFCDYILFVLPHLMAMFTSRSQSLYLGITYSLGLLYSLIYLVNTLWVQKTSVEQAEVQAQEVQQDESNYDLSKSTYSYLGESMFMSTQPSDVPKHLTSSRMFDSFMKQED